MSVLEKFLKYISIDTTSFEDAAEHVTKGQFSLAELPEKELQDLNLNFVHYDKKILLRIWNSKRRFFSS